MARIYMFPKLGAQPADIKQVELFLGEVGQSVEVPNNGEKQFGCLLDAPAPQPAASALYGWHRRTMDWADTLLVMSAPTPCALLTAGSLGAMGKRTILLLPNMQPSPAQFLFTDIAFSMDEALDIIGVENLS